MGESTVPEGHATPRNTILAIVAWISIDHIYPKVTVDPP